MKKTLKIFATLVILITFPLVVYAQTTTEDTKTTTSVDNSTTSEKETTTTKETTDTTNKETVDTTKETVKDTSTTTTPTTSTAAAKKTSSYMDYLPYILIAGSVILFFSIVGILLSSKKKQSEQVIQVTPEPTVPQTEIPQTVDMANIPDNLTNETMTDNLDGAKPTLADIVNQEQAQITPEATSTMETPVPQTEPESIATSQESIGETMTVEEPVTIPQEPITTSKESITNVMPTQDSTAIPTTPQEATVSTMPTQDSTISTTPQELVVEPVPNQELDQSMVNTVQPIQSQSDETQNVVPDATQSSTETVSNTDSSIDQAVAVDYLNPQNDAVPAQNINTEELIQPEVNTVAQATEQNDLQELINNEVNNMPQQPVSTPIIEPKVDDTPSSELPAVPPMM
ncbi:MAG: hypothetical protein ACOX6Q_02935 [Candidatus Dojkabacteria bacterium]|jgi:hypothetical protein